MDKLILARPTMDMEAEALAYRQEHFDAGETVINGSELFDQIDDYAVWADRVARNSHEDTVAPDWVLTDTFFAVRESDGRIVGIIDLRCRLKGFLEDFGHCGYSVRPSERNKGYATEMLAQICAVAKAHGLTELQLAVEPDNRASVRTIEKNGGVYRRSFPYGDGTADVYMLGL